MPPAFIAASIATGLAFLGVLVAILRTAVNVHRTRPTREKIAAARQALQTRN